MADRAALPASPPIHIPYVRPSRGPWWLVLLICATLCLALTVVTFLQALTLVGQDPDSRFTGLVNRPLEAVGLMGFVIGLVAMGIVLIRELAPLARRIIAGVALAAILSLLVAGLVQSQSRRHIGAAMLKTANGFAVPAGAFAVGRPTLSTDAGEGAWLGLPSVTVTWRPATAGSSACGVVSAFLATHPRWSKHDCSGEFDTSTMGISLFATGGDVEMYLSPNS